MKCTKCKGKNISKIGKRYNKHETKQLYFCNKCKIKFVEQNGFERMRHKKEHIIRAIHLHNKGLSLFQVKNHLWQHDGIKVSRETIREWHNKYGIF